MMKKEIINTIKSRGYWRINFQPLVDKKKLQNLGDCKDIVEKNRVQLRGWDYPHFSYRSDEDSGIETGNNYIGSWVEWWNHIEFWRMYESGQFLHYLALREDGGESDGWGIVKNSNIPAGKYLSIVGTIYQITEIFEFLSRLARENLYDEGVKLSISLHNTENRSLKLEDPMRGPLFNDYKADIDEIPFTQEYSKTDLLLEPQELALNAIKHFFERFNWHNQPLEVFKKDQDTLLNRRF